MVKETWNQKPEENAVWNKIANSYVREEDKIYMCGYFNFINTVFKSVDKKKKEKKIVWKWDKNKKKLWKLDKKEDMKRNIN